MRDLGELSEISGLFPLGEEKKYEVRKKRMMKGKCVPHYAAVEPQGKGVILASEKPFTFTEVDGVPLEEPHVEDMEVEKSGEKPHTNNTDAHKTRQMLRK